MLELPDAEVLKENLTPRMVDRTVRGVEVLNERLFLGSPRSPDELEGLSVGPAGRRGTYVFLTFKDGPQLVLDLAPWAWVWHGSSTYAPTRTTGLRMILDDGMELRIILPGPRMLASAWVADRPEEVEPVRQLGPDPMGAEFTRKVFQTRVDGRRRMLKNLLMERGTVPGVGDAYADEILFASRLSPIRYAHTLSSEQVSRLYECVPSTLAWAIGVLGARLKGALFEKEIRDFLQVHGHGGSPCPQCGTRIAEVRFDERMINYCPNCQSG